MSYQWCLHEFIEMDEGFLLVLDSYQYDKIPLRYLRVYMNEDEIDQILRLRKQC